MTLNYLKLTLILLLTQLTLAEKLEITSDTMHAESLNHEIHFVGNARVEQLKDWITADEIIVYLNENNKTDRYEAIGKANFEFENEKGHYLGNADIVKYYPDKTIYELVGKAKTKDLLNKRTVKGEKITVNMKTGNSKVIGGKDKHGKNVPVKITLDTGN